MKPLINKVLLSKFAEAQKGFTLIELLVVTIIVGILAAISIPNLINSIGKARESEAASNLGTLSRSQQAYHFETQIFADTMEKLGSNIALNASYYTFADPLVANQTLAKHQAIAINAGQSQVRNYASGIYYDLATGSYDIAICRAIGINQVVEAPNINTGDCTNGGRRLD